MKNLPNEEVLNLLNQISKENDKAFDTLIKAYQSDFVRLANRWVYNVHDAEDIVQDAFMSIWDKPQGFNGKCKFSTYFYVIVKRRYQDWLRKNGVKKPEPNPPIESWPDFADALDVALEKKEMNDALRECVNKLPDEQRSVLELSYFKEEKYLLIAETLNIPLGTVKTRVKYGIAKLAECMKRLMGQGV